MIDVDHPMSEHIFAAARAEDAILTAAKQMTVATRQQRTRLCEKCAWAFADLRRLSCTYFPGCPAIPPAIDALERSLSGLATMPGVPEQGPLVEFTCPACGTAIRRHGRFWFSARKSRSEIYCSKCLQIIMPSLEILSSCEEGFGTEAI